MKYIIFSIFIILHYSGFAQYNITGNIFNIENEPLVGATVVLLDLDSTMIAFSLTNNDGKYFLEDIEQGEYILQSSYISYANYSKKLELNWTDKTIKLDPILLEESSEILQEITINADHIPMGIKGDTISYNASAFKTRPNATVEDLLKKLPGIEVERDGSIKAQGEDVDKVLVDGKEFFGSDPKMATKNLEAQAVDKVEVFDKKSEIAEFTGVDDGEDEKTINLKLKEEYKKGGFGNLNLGGGTEESYETKMNYFRFTPKLQASAIFASNNLNKETFTIDDRISFMGGIGNAMSNGVLNLSDYAGIEDGINKSLSAGSNLSYDISSKFKFNAHYVFNRNENILEQLRNIYGFSDDFDYNSNDSINSNKENSSHQLNTRMDFKINPLTEIVFKNNGSLGQRNQFRNSSIEYYKSQIYQGKSLSTFDSNNDSYGFDTNTLFKRKFTKIGRNLISSFTFKNASEQSNEWINNRNRLIGSSFDIFQNQEYGNLSNQWSASANYTEPLSKKYYLGFNYKYGLSKESPTRDYYDIGDNVRALNTDLSAIFKKTYAYNIAGLSLRRNTSKVKMNFGLQGQLTQLNGLINDGEQSIEGNYKHLLPSFNLDYEMKGGKSMNLDYTTNVIAPTLDQLLPLPDNTNANYQFIGNPNLIPEYNQGLGFRFNYFDNFSFTNFFANLNITQAKNRIVYKTNIDENLFRTIQSINTDNYWDISSFLSFSRPLKPLKINYRIRTRMRYANYDSYINDAKSNVVDNNLNLRFSITNRKTEHFSLETGVSLDYDTKKYGVNPDFNQNYFNTNYFLDAETYLPKGWTISSSFNYRKYSAETFSDDPSYSLWAAAIHKLFLKDKLEIRFSVNDILKENIGYRRQGNENSIQQVYFNNLSRYFMVGANYKIGNAGQESGIRIEMD